MDAVIDVNEFIQYVGALIALINPVSKIPVILALTVRYSAKGRRDVAIVASVTVLITLLVVSVLGREILHFFAITPDLFRVAGGLIILLNGISMLRPDGQAQQIPAEMDHNPAIVPLGIPLLAGPGAIATAILYASHHHENWANSVAHAAGILAATLVTLGCLLAAEPLERLLGKNGMRVITQIMGLILTAIGVEMMVGGLSDHFGWPSVVSP